MAKTPTPDPLVDRTLRLYARLVAVTGTPRGPSVGAILQARIVARIEMMDRRQQRKYYTGTAVIRDAAHARRMAGTE